MINCAGSGASLPCQGSVRTRTGLVEAGGAGGTGNAGGATATTLRGFDFGAGEGFPRVTGRRTGATDNEVAGPDGETEGAYSTSRTESRKGAGAAGTLGGETNVA